MAEQAFLTVQEIAERLKVNEETVRRWLRSSELEGILLGDKAGYRISEAALQRFLDRRTIGGGGADRVMPPDRDTTTDARGG